MPYETGQFLQGLETKAGEEERYQREDPFCTAYEKFQVVKNNKPDRLLFRHPSVDKPANPLICMPPLPVGAIPHLLP